MGMRNTFARNLEGLEHNSVGYVHEARNRAERAKVSRTALLRTRTQLTKQNAFTGVKWC